MEEYSLEIVVLVLIIYLGGCVLLAKGIEWVVSKLCGDK